MTPSRELSRAFLWSSKGARVRAATALMDRAGLTPAYAVEVRHKEDHAQQQATEVHLKDAQTLARDVLRALPEVVAVLPPDEVNAVLSELPILR